MNNRGIALIIVLTTVAIVSILAVQLNYTGRISARIANNFKREAAAFYLAKSSVNIAVLRLTIVNKLSNIEVGGAKLPVAVTDLIWNMPFVFPPPLELLSLSGKSDEAGLGAKAVLEKIKKDAVIGSIGYFDHKIEGLDSKININNVMKDEQTAQKFVEQMKNYYASKIESDESFGHRYPIEDFEAVVNNILDWMDKDENSRNGGTENAYYEARNPPYKARNAPMLTLSELNMIEGINEELYGFFAPMFTVYSGAEININSSSPEMLKTIDSRITDDDIKLLFKRVREEGNFDSVDEFLSWIGQNTAIPASNFNPLRFSLTVKEKNFKIIATGVSGKISKRITCYVSETYNKILNGDFVGQTIPGVQSGVAYNPNTLSAGGNTAIPSIVYWELY